MQKGRLKLNAVERKYLVFAIECTIVANTMLKLEEKLLLQKLIKKINSGIRYEARIRLNRS